MLLARKNRVRFTEKDTMAHEYGPHVDAMLQVNPETGPKTQ